MIPLAIALVIGSAISVAWIIFGLPSPDMPNYDPEDYK